MRRRSLRSSRDASASELENTGYQRFPVKKKYEIFYRAQKMLHIFLIGRSLIFRESLIFWLFRIPQDRNLCRGAWPPLVEEVGRRVTHIPHTIGEGFY
jgi:hypothetical protein